jgi:outer membrane murein-binding lipoprotein Lpp
MNTKDERDAPNAASNRHRLVICRPSCHSRTKVRSVKTIEGRPGILLTLVAVIASSALLSGCQTTIGGQTLPSPDYLTDDVQYFPAGPEFKLTNQVEAARKQAAEKEKLKQGF